MAIAASDPVVYTLAPSRPLPRIDTVKSIKHVVLSPQLLTRFNRFLRSWRVALTLGYWLGVALGTCVLFSPSAIGVPLAIVSMPLQLVPSGISVMAMRYDMVSLVAQGYEFWFMTLSNIAVCVLISFSFNDTRGVMLIGASAAFETALLLDANYRASRLVSVATVLGALTNIVYIACATFGVIEYGRDLELLRYKNRVLYADDALANLIATLVFLLVRNGVRKFRERDTKGVVTCITYRCRVALVPVKPSATPKSSSASQGRTPAAQKVFSRQTQMQFIDDRFIFSSNDTVLSLLWTRRGKLVLSFLNVSPVLHPMRSLKKRLLSFASYVSLAGWIIAAVATNAAIVQLATALAVSGAALVFTVYAAFAQSQLLLRLATSFDTVFLSVQLTIAHICLADIVGWSQPRALAVLTSWLWMHWVLLLDTVLPIHRTTRLGFRRVIAVAVLVLFVAEQILVTTMLIIHDDSSLARGVTVDPRLDLRDREIFTLAFHTRVKQLRVVPLLFGRLVTTISWSLRLLWRIWTSRRHDDSEELLMLQGRVQYEVPSSAGLSGHWLATSSELRIFPRPQS